MKTRLIVISILVISTACWLSTSWFNLAYDSPGIRGLLFWMCQVVAFPLWALSELLFTLHGSRAFSYHSAMSIALAWLVMVLILSALRIRLTRSSSE